MIMAEAAVSRSTFYRYFKDKYEGLPTDGYTAWFERMIDDEQFLEHACYSGNYYGTNKKFVDFFLTNFDKTT